MDDGIYVNADKSELPGWSMKDALSLPRNFLLAEQLFITESLQEKLSFLPCIFERELMIKYF